MNFGQGLESLKNGKAIKRKGWNGNGIYLLLQTPDEFSKMTLPYVYIETSFLETQNPNAPKGRVPWAPSQTDMLAEDWEESMGADVQTGQHIFLDLDSCIVN